MTGPGGDDETLRVTFRSIHVTEAGEQRMLSVFCPRHADVVSLEQCRRCASCHGLSIDPSDHDSFLRCTFQGSDPVEASLEGSVTSTDVAGESPTRRTKIAEVMTSPVRCATADMSIETLTALFLEQGISAVPVVDDKGKAIGIVSKTDVLRRYYEDGDTEQGAPVRFAEDSDDALELGPGFHMATLSHGRVADIMTNLVYALSAEASIARASALMAYEGVHRIVVTSGNGAAVGIVSSLDVLRWLAREDGFVIPGRTRQQGTEPPDDPT